MGKGSAAVKTTRELYPCGTLIRTRAGPKAAVRNVVTMIKPALREISP